MGSFESKSAPEQTSVNYKNCKSSYIRQISEVIALCNGRTINTIKPRDDSWAERYPCNGYGGGYGGGIIISFDDGNTANYICTSEETGAIMYYYKIDNPHFTQYIDQDERSLIDHYDNRSKSFRLY